MKTWLIEQLQKQNPLMSYFDIIGRPYHYLPKFQSAKNPTLYGIQKTDFVSASLYTIRKMKKQEWPLWYDQSVYSCDYYYSYYGKYLLNDDYIIIPVNDLKRRKDWLFKTFGVDNCIYYRPTRGDKTFSGGITKLQDFDIDATYSLSRSGQRDLMVIASPKNIQTQWRCVILNKKVIACSRYYSYGKLDTVQQYPVEVINKAQQIANVWQPNICFVLDICKSGDQYCLVQLNSFNSCGLYSCNIPKIVKAFDQLP